MSVEAAAAPTSQSVILRHFAAPALREFLFLSLNFLAASEGFNRRGVLLSSDVESHHHIGQYYKVIQGTYQWTFIVSI